MLNRELGCPDPYAETWRPLSSSPWVSLGKRTRKLADRSMVGARCSFTWQVEKGKIAELVAALGETNPICRDAEAALGEGYPDIVAPPTFSTVAVLWTSALFGFFERLKMPLSRIMHAEQGYEYYDPILPGDTLYAVMEVKSITSREGKSGHMDFVLFETVFTNKHGREVIKEEMLVVERIE